MYEKGKGISKDFVEAYKWFSISRETGTGMGGEAPDKIGAS